MRKISIARSVGSLKRCFFYNTVVIFGGLGEIFVMRMALLSSSSTMRIANWVGDHFIRIVSKEF